jgi:TonB family protein
VSAQQLPAAEASTLTPPRLKFNPGVVYPDRALRAGFDQRVTVVLVLEVAPDGHVRQSSITEPHGHGFDEAALAAAEKLVFEPATRDGRPIAARITFRHEFTPPLPKLVGRVARLATDAPVGGARVTVRDANNLEHAATTARDGTWSMEGLPPGPIQVTVTRRGDLPLMLENSVLGFRALAEGPIAHGWTIDWWYRRRRTRVAASRMGSSGYCDTNRARFFGWISYTLSRSERHDVPSEPLSLFQFDQTHVLTLLGNYKFGRG